MSKVKIPAVKFAQLDLASSSSKSGFNDAKLEVAAEKIKQDIKNSTKGNRVFKEWK